jgi:undecaprenyl-diphosphatase
LLFRNTRKSGLAVLLAMAVGGILTNAILKNAVARIRPYIANEEYKKMWELVGAHTVGSFSFPSGHTNVATNAILALVLALNNKKSAWLLIFPVVMGLSRIYLVVHYLTDVIGGFIVGGVAGLLGYLLAKVIFDLLEKRRDKKAIKGILDFDIIELIKKNKN